VPPKAGVGTPRAVPVGRGGTPRGIDSAAQVGRVWLRPTGRAERTANDAYRCRSNPAG
jgi:hypothetical protein